MKYSGPIDLAALVDLDSITGGSGTEHYTFFAFPISTLNEHGLPSDSEVQGYIAAVQSAGVPVGIWLNAPPDDTGYAAVKHENISQLHDVIRRLTQFSDSYLHDLCERLFRDVAAGS